MDTPRKTKGSKRRERFQDPNYAVKVMLETMLRQEGLDIEPEALKLLTNHCEDTVAKILRERRKKAEEKKK